MDLLVPEGAAAARTDAGVVAAAPKTGCTAILRGALPTAIVAVTVRFAKSTTETWLEHSLVKWAVWRLVQRYPRHFLPRGQVQPDERRGALLLGGHPRCAPVLAQRAVVGLGDRHLANDAIRRRVDDQRAVRAPARDQHPATGARDREPVGIGAHVDAGDHAVRGGVD